MVKIKNGVVCIEGLTKQIIFVCEKKVYLIYSPEFKTDLIKKKNYYERSGYEVHILNIIDSSDIDKANELLKNTVKTIKGEKRDVIR
jgi:hypothetical protein